MADTLPLDPPPEGRRTILFVCAHNSGRSQMAEAYVNRLYAERLQAYSAGTEPTALNPAVAAAMAEEGIDLSGHRAKDVGEFAGREFDDVVTVCDGAREACPFFPGGGRRMHESFADPSRCAGSPDEVLDCVRRIRDEIRAWVVRIWGDPAASFGKARQR